MSVVVGYLSAKRGKAALELGIKEAKLRDTSLVVVHSEPGGARADDEDIFSSDRDLKELEGQLSGTGIEFSLHSYVRGNEPSRDIVLAAEQYDAELIVIGLRKRTSAGKFLLGSNAHDILMEAPCPVLTVLAQ